jgi:hypothetical protein
LALARDPAASFDCFLERVIVIQRQIGVQLP